MRNTLRSSIANLFAIASLLLLASNAFAQSNALPISEYFLYGSNRVQINSSNLSDAGMIGSDNLVSVSGNGKVGKGVHSGGNVTFQNGNVVTGSLSAKNWNVVNPGFTAGSSTMITENLDVQGNVTINPSGSSVGGLIRVSGNYSGPGSKFNSTPQLQDLPTPPPPTNISTIQFPGGNETRTTLTPVTAAGSGGVYGSYSGQRVNLVFDGPGTYYINSVSANQSSNFTFNFKGNRQGRFLIYVRGGFNAGRISAVDDLGNTIPDDILAASRIYMEVQGTTGFVSANGSSQSPARWLGTIYAPNGPINLGSGTGTNSVFYGALWSGQGRQEDRGNTNLSVTVNSGVNGNYVAFVPGCSVANPAVSFVAVEEVAPSTINGKLTGALPCKDPDQLSPITVSTNITSATFTWEGPNVRSVDQVTGTAIIAAPGTYKVTVTNATCTASAEILITSCVVDGGNIVKTETKVLDPTLTAYKDNIDPYYVPAGDPPIVNIQGDQMLVDIIYNENKKTQALAFLAANTSFVQVAASVGVDVAGRMLNGWLKITDIKTVEDEIVANGAVGVFNSIAPTFMPILTNGWSEVPQSGAIKTNGAKAMASDRLREAYGVNGSGITIGVLSDSYGKQAAELVLDIQTGELPEFNVAPGDINVGEFPYSFGSDEGRGMMQLIHDVAPGAKLKFRTGFISELSMAENIFKLAYDDGCQIAVDDITYVTAPYFGKGPIAKAIDSVIKPISQGGKDVKYFTSAGNFGKRGYEPQNGFDDYDFSGDPTKFPLGITAGSKVHDFGTTTPGVPGFLQQIELKNANPASYLLVLQWDDPFYSTGGTGTCNDLDIHLTDITGRPLLGYNRTHNGLTQTNPFEILPFSVSGPTTINVMVVHAGGCTTPNYNIKFKFIIFRGKPSDVKFLTNEGISSTIIGHAASPSAMTVAAAPYKPYHNLIQKLGGDDPNDFKLPSQIAVESFSSIGFKVNNEVVKPDFTGPDGAPTSVVLGPLDQQADAGARKRYNFFGTSAAAPHVAALAALLMEANTKFNGFELSNAQVKEKLKASAVDITATAGVDIESGWGYVNGMKSVEQLVLKPNPRPIVTQVTLDNGTVLPAISFEAIGTNTDNIDPRAPKTPQEVTLNGFNFIPGLSKVIVGDDTLSTNSITATQIKFQLTSFAGDPPVYVYNPPNPGFPKPAKDGGNSDSVYFLSGTKKFIRIETYAELVKSETVNNVTTPYIYYGEPIPSSVTYDGIITPQSKLKFKFYLDNVHIVNPDLAAYGLAGMILNLSAPAPLSPGTYNVTATLPDRTVAQLQAFDYATENGVFKVKRLPVTITPLFEEITYGDVLPRFDFSYTGLPTDLEPDANISALTQKVKDEYEASVAPGLAVYDGVTFDAGLQSVVTTNKLVEANKLVLANKVVEVNKIVEANKIVEVNVLDGALTNIALMASEESLTGSATLANGVTEANKVVLANKLVEANKVAEVNSVVIDQQLANKFLEINKLTEVNKVAEVNKITEVNKLTEANSIVSANGILISEAAPLAGQEGKEVTLASGVTLFNGIILVNKLTEANKIAEVNGVTNKVAEVNGVMVNAGLTLQNKVTEVNKITEVNKVAEVNAVVNGVEYPTGVDLSLGDGADKVLIPIPQQPAGGTNYIETNKLVEANNTPVNNPEINFTDYPELAIVLNSTDVNGGFVEGIYKALTAVTGLKPGRQHAVFPGALFSKNFDVNYGVGVMQVNKKPVTVAFVEPAAGSGIIYDAQTKTFTTTYNGLAKAVTAKTTADFPLYDEVRELTPTVIKYNGSVDAPINAGTYTVTAHYTDADGNYQDGTIEGTLIINKKAATISFSSPDLTYNAGTNEFSATYNGAGKSVVATTYEAGTTNVIADPAAVITYKLNGGTVTSPTNAGTYAVTAAFAGNDNFESATATTSLVINKADAAIDVTFTQPYVYNGTVIAPTVVVTGVIANDPPLTPSLTYSYTGTVNGGTPYASSTAPKDAGTYSVIVSSSGLSNYKDGSSAATAFTIDKAPATVNLENQSYTFDNTSKPVIGGSTSGVNAETNLSPALTYTYTGINGTSYVGSATAPTNAGTYSVLASFAGNNNYESASKTVTLTITKAAVTSVTVSVQQPYTYSGTTNPIPTPTVEVKGIGGVVLSPTLTYSYSGTVNGGVAYGPTPDAPVNAGSYNVTVSYSGLADYADGSATPKSFTIGKAVSTVNVSDLTTTFDGTPKPVSGTTSGVNGETNLTPALTYTYTGINGTSYTGSATAPTNAGTYSVLASFAGNNNYQSASNTVTLTITKAAVTSVTVTVQPYTYSGTTNPIPIPTVEVKGIGGVVLSPSLTYSYSGTVNGGATYGTTPNRPVNAGSYSVTVSYSGLANYADGSATPQSFTIDKATPTIDITTASLNQTFNGSTRPVTGTTSGVNGETNLSPALTYTYTGINGTTYSGSTAPTNVGTYSVLASFAGNNNYESAGKTVTLTITKAAVTSVTVSVQQPYTYSGTTNPIPTPTVEVKGIGSVVLSPTLTYSYSGTVNGGAGYGPTQDRPVNAGSYSVTVTYSGLADYADGSSSAKTFSIGKSPSTTINVADRTATYTGSPIGIIAGTTDGVNGETGLTPALTYAYSGTNYTQSANPPTLPGTYSVVASFAGNENYLSNTKTVTLRINGMTLNVKANDLITNNGTTPVFTSTFTPSVSNINVSYRLYLNVNGSPTGSPITNFNGLAAGEYTIEPFAISGTNASLYDPSYQTGILYVNPYGNQVKSIKPSLDCVEVGPTTVDGIQIFYAHYSYVNPNGVEVRIPRGPDNEILAPAGTYIKGLPPVRFMPSGGKFKIEFDGSKSITWVLSSFERRQKTSSGSVASSSSNKCGSGFNTNDYEVITSRRSPGTAVNQATQVADKAYPNPFTSRVNIESDFTGYTEKDVKVFDMTGREYSALSVRRISSTRMELDLSHLLRGQYMIRVSGKAGTKVFRVIRN